MPLQVHRLLSSETWIEAAEDPRLGHVLMSLWSESWHQVPAGSLPNNDRVLRRLSMCPTEAEWERIKKRALASWVECSDGLLYHPVVVELAREAWERKLAQRERTAAASAAREAKRRAREQQAIEAQRNVGRDDERNDEFARNEERNVERNVERNEERDVERNVERNEERDVHQGTGTGTGTVKGQGQGQGQGESAREGLSVSHITSTNQEPPVSPLRDAIERRTQIAILLRNAGIDCQAHHPSVDMWSRTGVTNKQLSEAVDVARRYKRPPAKIPVAYLGPIVKELVDRPADAGGNRERDWSYILGEKLQRTV